MYSSPTHADNVIQFKEIDHWVASATDGQMVQYTSPKFSECRESFRTTELRIRMLGNSRNLREMQATGLDVAITRVVGGDVETDGAVNFCMHKPF
ncbi:uncharacterized protein EMH_0092330 [Eimeria mitis]|uniref:Uncharacterized protein n=1 Tax=Eimeria mitis TaxID=44415 RepID=U6KMF2_9EIME|nr:uncharacterized protein EMH_0092330 [Eimeria mitis]CDJ36633.1 hypothetical protein, conserved [Eimeria mitis]